ncbi:MAG: hypothetical protein WCS89_03440 [Candidatus Paceibacterota bacterium]|jgi:hypothetical protein
MLNKLKNIFRRKKSEDTKKYESLSDFFMHAPADEQKKVFTEAARKANEDQMRIFKQAQLKVEV